MASDFKNETDQLIEEALLLPLFTPNEKWKQRIEAEIEIVSLSLIPVQRKIDKVDERLNENPNVLSKAYLVVLKKLYLHELHYLDIQLAQLKHILRRIS